jgi:hypothetical protein
VPAAKKAGACYGRRPRHGDARVALNQAPARSAHVLYGRRELARVLSRFGPPVVAMRSPYFPSRNALERLLERRRRESTPRRRAGARGPARLVARNGMQPERRGQEHARAREHQDRASPRFVGTQTTQRRRRRRIRRRAFRISTARFFSASFDDQLEMRPDRVRASIHIEIPIAAVFVSGPIGEGIRSRPCTGPKAAPRRRTAASVCAIRLLQRVRGSPCTSRLTVRSWTEAERAGLHRGLHCLSATWAARSTRPPGSACATCRPG